MLHYITLKITTNNTNTITKIQSIWAINQATEISGDKVAALQLNLVVFYKLEDQNTMGSNKHNNISHQLS